MKDAFSNIRLNDQEYSKRYILEYCDNPDWLNSHEEYLKQIFLFMKEWVNESDSIPVQTSGSTGTPKIIRLKKKHMIHSAMLTQQYFQLNNNSNALLCMPVEYIAGKMMIVRAFVTGFNLNAISPSANPFKAIKQKIDFTAVTPFQLYHSLEDLKHLNIKKIIVGGGDISVDLKYKIRNLQTKIYATYGMTETCSHVALRKVNEEDAADAFTALKGISFQQDERECLIILAPGLSEAKIVTNDVVELSDNTHFIWKGRFDNVINTGGIKVYPEVIEKKISGIIGRPFFISSLKDEILSEKVILFIEGEALPTDENKNIVHQLKERLAKYEIPKEIIFTGKFYYSASGKIRRKQTIEHLRDKG